jgi:diguanylate cyclase (GGDEF)-like protein
MHIVVVDPSRVALKLIAEMLLPRGDRVDLCTNSVEALQYIEATPSVDVLVTSLEVEPMPGIELCWRTRLLATEHRPIHIIVMSSRDSDRSLAEALDSGADDYIVKPVSRDALRARLRAADRMMLMQRHLMTLAETDPLTGLLNRRAFFSRITHLGNDSRDMPIVVCDIDHFKRVNDTFGHDVGDRVLTAVAREVAQTGHLAVRLGGEEFAIALPGRNVREALRIAERLRLVAAALEFTAGDTTFSITTSFGIGIRRGEEITELALKRADIALYRAKTDGRNRVDIEPQDLVQAAA